MRRLCPLEGMAFKTKRSLTRNVLLLFMCAIVYKCILNSLTTRIDGTFTDPRNGSVFPGMCLYQSKG